MRKLLTLFAVAMLFSVLATAQTKPLSGKIVDATGQPVPFATVRVKGTNKGVSADADGNYIIKASPGQTLIVSGAGMSPKEETVPNSPTFNISVTLKNASMTEVVVTALGVKRQPKQLGYSTAVVNAKDLNEASVTNLAQGLSGKVSGVDIRLADNSVNPNIQITLRGNRSIAGDNGALIVVDGIIVDQSYLATMNPEDVESTTVLKGANGAALYGKDASNGVLVITTKKGRKGLNINYKNSTMWNKVSYMPSLQSEYSPNGGEPNYIDPLTQLPLPVPFENQNFGPAYNSKDFPYTQIAIGGPDSAGNYKYGPYKAYPNGRKDFFRTGTNEQNELSVGGANKWGSFYVSGQHAVNNGIVYNDKSTRDATRFNGTLKFGRLSIQGGASYSHLDVNQAGLVYGGGTQYRPVYWSVINQPPNIDLKTVKNVDGDYYDNPSGYVNQYYTNPWYQVFHSRNIEKTNAVTSNLTIDYKILPWLSVTARTGYNRTSANDPSHIDSFSYSPTAATDPWGAGGTAVTAPTMPYQYELIKVHYDDWNSDGFLTAKKKYGDFDFTLLGGVNYRRRTSHGYWFSNQATASLAVPNGTTKVTNADGSAYANYDFKTYQQSAYGDLTIGYQGWAFLHATYRNDWLSILYPQTRSFGYEGVDASVILSDKFPQIVTDNGISFLKVRASYSSTGNVSLPSVARLGFLADQNFGIALPTYGAYGIYPGVTVGNGFPYGSLNGYSLSYNSVQPNLKPEKDNSVEFGVQVGLWKNRIDLEASYYATGVYNQTVTSSVSGATGLNTVVLNTGKVQDNGAEIDLKLTPFLNFGKFNWNLAGNFTWINDKVVYLRKGDTSSSSKLVIAGTANYNIDAVPGKDYLSLYVSDWNRDPQGHIIVDGTTGLPSANPNLVYAGNTLPKYRLGITSNWTYQRFGLSAVLEYRGGNKMLNTMGQALDFAGISSTSAENRSHFIVPGSVIQTSPGHYAANTSVPTSGTAAQWWSTTYNGISAPYVVSAAFWKLREVALTYDIPVNAFGSQKVVKKLTLALIAQNLFMWRPKTNQWTDPEFSSSINTNANAVGVASEYLTPPLRSFGFSVNAQF